MRAMAEPVAGNRRVGLAARALRAAPRFEDTFIYGTKSNADTERESGHPKRLCRDR